MVNYKLIEYLFKIIPMTNLKPIKATAKYIRMSPNKVRRVLNQVRGCSYINALMILEFLPYAAKDPLKKLLNSAASNAEHNYHINKSQLIIHEAFVNQGPKIKKIRPRAKGQAYKILKPTCHITIIMKKKVI